MARPRQQRIDPKRARTAMRSRSGAKKGAPPVRTATARDWIGGARLRTLPLSIAPVALGTASAHVADGFWHGRLALLSLAVAVFLQIGVNYANDYSDGVRGTDRFRVGPSRLTGSGAAKPRHVLIVALVFLGLAAVAGLGVVVLSGHWWLLAVGAAALAAAWFYTGGKKPYGYAGLGELVVFVFFGLVATAGTTYVQVGTVNIESWLSGAAAGLLACAVLMVNNLRDREQDALAGKRTLSVRVGDRASRVLFVTFVAVPYGILAFFAVFYLWAPYVFFTAFLAIPAIVITVWATTARELVLSLQLTSLTALAYGLSLAAAIAF